MNKLFIIKIGGNVLDNPTALDLFLKDFAAIKEPRYLFTVEERLRRRLAINWVLNRIILMDEELPMRPTLDLVTMVYGGLVNKQIVAKLTTAWLQCTRRYRCRWKYDQSNKTPGERY